MDGAVVQKNAVVGAGALVSPGKVVAAGTFWAGVPAVQQQALTADEISAFSMFAAENVELALVHAEESSKTWQQIEIESDNRSQLQDRSTEYYRRETEEQLQHRAGEFENHMIPGRIFETNISARSKEAAIDK
jgi:hypothetical protein